MRLTDMALCISRKTSRLPDFQCGGVFFHITISREPAYLLSLSPSLSREKSCDHVCPQLSPLKSLHFYDSSALCNLQYSDSQGCRETSALLLQTDTGCMVQPMYLADNQDSLLGTGCLRTFLTQIMLGRNCQSLRTIPVAW